MEHDDQSRLYALWHAGMTYVLLRNVDKVAEIGSKLTVLANDRQLPYWQALGDFLCGWRAMRAGRAADAVGLLQAGSRTHTGCVHVKILKKIADDCSGRGLGAG